MATQIHYGRLMHKALRGLMAEVLADVAETGLPGDHHFLIKFDTTHPGVDIPAYLKDRHPQDMTIVLQEWFDNLTVIGDRFAVTLNFADELETLVVPFDAIRTFVDPSVEFGLRFDPTDEEDGSPDPEPTEPEPEPDPEPVAPEDPPGEVVSLDKFRKS